MREDGEEADEEEEDDEEEVAELWRGIEQEGSGR
jgi:hypothetical protein